MKRDEVKDWLDALVDIVEQRRTLHKLNDRIRTHEPEDYIFLSQGIDIVSGIMGLELTLEKKKDSKFTYQYSFTYRGIHFIDYREEPLGEREGVYVPV